MAIPDMLQRSYQHWATAGKPQQVTSQWKRKAWTKYLPSYATLFTEVAGNDVSRAAATAWASKIESAATAERAFIVAMMWGYGPVGYGPYRTERTLTATDGFADKIYEVASVAREQGGLTAYRFIGTERKHSRGYLKHLGPAFGTKFLYFVTKASTQATTPVMDAVVQRWFSRNMPNVPLTLDWSSDGSYERYLNCLREWADELNKEADDQMAEDDVEYLIFKSGSASEGGTSWSMEADESATMTAAELLEKLETELEASGKADEAAQPLETLYRIVAESDER